MKRIRGLEEDEQSKENLRDVSTPLDADENIPVEREKLTMLQIFLKGGL